ncbi:hypothetical protein AB2L28_18415 [Kineococcus sp. TBRC 1896]|uniref:Uncharacterized protein n=1 Tax=Kineococcus mangrovi TaxID=1660183 RepID=A0ABV4I836_9ACTN
MGADPDQDVTTPDPRARWRTLPPRVRPEDTVAELDVGPVPEPGPSQDPNRAAALRFPFPGV